MNCPFKFGIYEVGTGSENFFFKKLKIELKKFKVWFILYTYLKTELKNSKY